MPRTNGGGRPDRLKPVTTNNTVPIVA